MNKLSVTEMPIGWLAPSGLLYECEIYEHYYLASKIIHDFNYSFSSTESDEDLLLKCGWARITRSLMSGEYVIYWDNFLTDYQKNYLRPFMENKAISIGKTSRLCFEEEDGK